MRFSLTTEQQDLRDAVRELMQDLCPAAVVRAAVDPDHSSIRALDSAITALGASGLLVDTAHGGLGLDENYLVPMLIEAGKAAAPLPLSETIGVAAGVLTSGGMAAALAAGELSCVADAAGSGLVRYGRADRLLVQGGWGGVGQICVLDLAEAEIMSVPAVDPAGGLTQISGGRQLFTVDDPQVVELAWHRGVLGASAQLVGLSQAMLAMTVGYVIERQQFGTSIGSFQAVKHHLASAAMAVEFAGPAVARAAAALAAGEDAPVVHVSTAKALASDAAEQMARTAIQCHGAIGYTTEYDLHLFAKRAWALAADWGSAGWHRDRVATELGLLRSGTGPTH